MSRPVMPSIVRRIRPQKPEPLIHWNRRGTHDETTTSRRHIIGSVEGYLLIIARPKLNGMRTTFYALSDPQTLIGQASTRQRAEKLCERHASDKGLKGNPAGDFPRPSAKPIQTEHRVQKTQRPRDLSRERGGVRRHAGRSRQLAARDSGEVTQGGPSVRERNAPRHEPHQQPLLF